MATFNLGNYLPKSSALSNAQIIAARKVLEAYAHNWWPGLDTRVNSVFGDLHLTPLAILAAGLDTALANLNSDLNPNNLASGTITNTDFVTQYFKNFGAPVGQSVGSTGVVCLTPGPGDLLRAYLSRPVIYRVIIPRGCT